MPSNLSSILQDHVSLAVSCIDRIYLNGYLPRLQTSGQLCYFLRDHLGYPIPSPALFPPLRNRFLKDIHRFAEAGDIPLVHFQQGQRKDDLANQYRARFDAPEGVVFIGVAQEKAYSFKSRQEPGGAVPSFDFTRQSVAVNHYYFYLQDPEWGPAFIKVCSYLPYAVRLCLNGHEWAKQQLRHQGIGFESLDNGFLACEDPQRLQAICDALGPDEVQSFFDRWLERLPWPLTQADRAAGFQHRLAIWQLEVSLTQVFDRPVEGRHFFTELIRENLDLGRPDRVSLLFPTRQTSRTPAPGHGYQTRVITAGVNPSLHVAYKRSQVKQYFKEEHALRTETTINDPGDFRCLKGLAHLPYLRGAGEQVNRKLLEVERLSQDCVLSQDALDRLQGPSQEAGGRAPGLHFGDRRVMALLQALCGFAHLPQGFHNRDPLKVSSPARCLSRERSCDRSLAPHLLRIGLSKRNDASQARHRWAIDRALLLSRRSGPATLGRAHRVRPAPTIYLDAEPAMRVRGRMMLALHTRWRCSVAQAFSWAEIVLG